MGMYDIVYAALDCPYCGRHYRYAPLSAEQAAADVRQHKTDALALRQRFLAGEQPRLYMQDMWAKQAGFDDVDQWIAQLDSPAEIERWRTRPYLGLPEIQTKAFDRLLDNFYVGDEVPAYSGHYYVQAAFDCASCSTSEATVYVNVWLEIEERKLKAVLTRDPETGEPGRDVVRRVQPAPREPDPHPPLHFQQHGYQGVANYNPATGNYDLTVRYLPDKLQLSHPDAAFLRRQFDAFVADYRHLVGVESAPPTSLHAALHAICRHLPSDFKPYGERERTGPDCSAGCRHFLALPGALGMDWGVCANPASPRAGLLTFEHQGCEQFAAQDA